MKEVTYFFGAGASCQSMPLVNNFYIRFELFKSVLNNRYTLGQKIHNDINSFSNQIKSHLSFDTFFKKLFHQDKTEEITKYKGLLLLYFLFEHLFLPEDIGYGESYEENLNKKFIIDLRYEALIAGLLKPIKGIDFYRNINFLTWNYDVNLLNALRNFVAPSENLNDFINSRVKENFLIINPQVKVFHLNGFVIHPLLNQIGEENLSSAFNEIIKEYERSQLNDYSTYIKFAWEQGIEDFKKISTVISESNMVIKIGYSLPLYNRIFDLHLINEQTLRNTELYIQNMDVSSIKNILESDFEIFETSKTKEDPDIIFSQNCNSFIIPNNVFN